MMKIRIDVEMATVVQIMVDEVLRIEEAIAKRQNEIVEYLNKYGRVKVLKVRKCTFFLKWVF